MTDERRVRKTNNIKYELKQEKKNPKVTNLSCCVNDVKSPEMKILSRYVSPYWYNYVKYVLCQAINCT